jgi:inorganic pyrophosphatase
MADFNKILTPGDYENGELNVVIEIPVGSTQKIEYRKETGLFEIDRIEPDLFAKPANYGFIPRTLDEDGDELDVLLISPLKLTTGTYIKAKIIGVMHFIDDNEVDDKILAVPADDRNTGDIYSSYEDLPEKLLKQIEFHFNHYKDLKKPGSTVVKGFAGVEEAKKVIKDAIARADS